MVEFRFGVVDMSLRGKGFLNVGVPAMLTGELPQPSLGGQYDFPEGSPLRLERSFQVQRNVVNSGFDQRGRRSSGLHNGIRQVYLLTCPIMICNRHENVDCFLVVK